MRKVHVSKRPIQCCEHFDRSQQARNSGIAAPLTMLDTVVGGIREYNTGMDLCNVYTMTPRGCADLYRFLPRLLY
jgi:hypothetical protein